MMQWYKSILVSCLLASVLLGLPCPSSSVELDCDPCIDRKRAVLGAVLPPGQGDSMVQASMKQAALDLNIDLRLELASSLTDMALAFESLASKGNLDALLVTIPNARVEAALLEIIKEYPHLPMFGWGWGYASKIIADHALGWIANDEAATGKQAALAWVQRNLTLTSKPIGVVTIDKATSESTRWDAPATTRWQAFAETWQTQTNKTQDKIALVTLHNNDNDLVSPLMENCPYQALLLDSTVLTAPHYTDILQQATKCGTALATVLGDDPVTPQLYRAITKKELDFAIDPELSLQASMTVVTAALYVTTGKAIAKPLDQGTYFSGPKIVDARNVPSDTAALCKMAGFPVCSVGEPVTNVLVGTTDDGNDLFCPCVQRNEIRIGGVVHGAANDAFWDPVFAAARQAATDMDITLDLERFQPQDDFQIIADQMAARIRTLCDSGVDGIFVSVSSPTILPAIQRCQDLMVPVLSVNSGEGLSRQLGLLNHVGQAEFLAGYKAAQRLMQAGMTRGFCIDQEYGNAALLERCQGFEAAIAESNGDAVFEKHLPVPFDNQEQIIITLQEAVGPGNWDGVGFLQLGQYTFPGLRRTLEEHPGAIAGSFDLADGIFQGIQDGILRFTIDQQAFLQGSLPVYLLTYLAYTQESLTNHLVQSGPSYMTEPPSDALKVCEANNFAICPDRPYENLSYIPSSLLAIGYALFGFLASACFLALAWTYFSRAKWVVRVSQPMFLDMTVMGTLVSSSSILFMGLQTGYRRDQDESGELMERENPEIAMVDAACMAVPWLYGMGFVITFSALFAKIHRVKLIYQAGIEMKRKRVTLHEVFPIMVTTFLIEFGILISWQLVAPLKWEREVLDEFEGFPTLSVGSCANGSEGWSFFLAMVIFHVLCLCYALALCFQTKDINSDFAESSYISLAVAFMFQVLVLAAPITSLVRDSTDVFYFVRAIAVFLQNFTVLALIFVPKVIRMQEDERNPMARTRSLTLSKKVMRRSEKRSEKYSKDSWGGADFSDVQNSQSLHGNARSGDLNVIHEESDNKFSVPEQAPSYSERSAKASSMSDSYADNQLTVTEQAPPSFSERSEKTSTMSDCTDGGQPNVFLSFEEALSDWKILGFSSKSIVEKIVQLMRRSTTTMTRQTITGEEIFPETTRTETFTALPLLSQPLDCPDRVETEKSNIDPESQTPHAVNELPFVQVETIFVDNSESTAENDSPILAANANDYHFFQ